MADGLRTIVGFGGRGLVQPGNIDPFNRPILYNGDGSYSTTSSMSFNDGAFEVLVPTVVGGKRLTDEQAKAHYYDTGEHLGKFRTPDDADLYATKLHNRQAAYVSSSGQLDTVRLAADRAKAPPRTPPENRSK